MELERHLTDINCGDSDCGPRRFLQQLGINYGHSNMTHNETQSAIFILYLTMASRQKTEENMLTC